MLVIALHDSPPRAASPIGETARWWRQPLRRWPLALAGLRGWRAQQLDQIRHPGQLPEFANDA